MSNSDKRKQDWARHRKEITKLWSEDGKEAPEVREIMIRNHGFEARVESYKRQFKNWGLDHKYLRSPESMAILGIAYRRHHKENKATIVHRYDKLVEPGKFRRFHKRQLKKDPNFSPDMRATTPPNITYGTPEPDMLKYSVVPASSPRPNQKLGRDTPGSHHFDGEGSSLTGTASWEASPGSYSGLSGDPYSGTEQPSHTNMPGDFQDQLSGHQQSYGLQGFAQTNTGSRFAPQPWVGPTETPSHPYHASGYGTSWPSHPQPPQPLQQAMHSLNPSPTALAFPNHYNPGIGYGVLDNAMPGQTIIGIPEAPSNDLEYMMPLHGAVVGNDINSARALLQNGANPTSAAQGGVTPLHCAAYQKNVDMVKLLLRSGASLEATTEKGQSVLFFAVCGQGQSGRIDMPGYGTATIATQMGNGLHTDESALRIIDALFECPRHFVPLHNSIDKPDSNGVTPLMIAAGEGFFTTARALLKHRAQPDQRDHADHTALNYAAMNNHRNVVRLLLQVDPAVSDKPDVSHILELAGKNIAGGGQGGLRKRRYGPAEILVAKEIVWRCRRMRVSEQLLTLAAQRGETAVLECLQYAMAQLDSEGSHAAGA